MGLSATEQKILNKFGFTIQGDTTIGSREYQEDRTDVQFINKNALLLTVTDGHGGVACSEFVIKTFPAILKSLLKQRKKERINTLMKSALKKTNDLWNIKCFGANFKAPKTAAQRTKLFKKINYTRYQKSGLNSGSTITSAYIDVEKEIAYILNLGDSRAQWQIKDTLGATIDHTPNLQNMSGKTKIPITITTSEGDVPRINGELAVGRSIGDNTLTLTGAISRQPDTVVIRFKNKSIYLVIATDGLWDEMKAQNLFQQLKSDVQLNFFKTLHPADNSSLITFRRLS